MRPIKRIVIYGLPALALLAACEDNIAPELGGVDDLSSEALEEVRTSVDDELTGALLEDVRFALESEGVPASASLAQAEQAFTAAANAYHAGDAAGAQAKADEARLALGSIWMDGLGDVGLDELFERAYHLRESVAAGIDCVRDTDRLLRAIDRLIDRAERARDAGNRKRAAAYLILVGQLVDRACVDVDVDGDGFNALARLSVARADAAVDLATRLLPDDATPSQLRLLHRATHLAEWAGTAYQNHHFRRAFALARRAEITALRAVIDIDGLQDGEVRSIHEVAETLLQEAMEIAEPTPVQERLIGLAETLYRIGVEKLEAGNLRGVVSLWRSAVVSLVVLS